MMQGVWKYLVAILLLGLPAPSIACDGTPPELTNKDKEDHSYELVCAKKTEKRTIKAGATEKLKEKSGCQLKLGQNPPTKLYTEMVCTIKDGKLSCDLL
jgi:hypothetical protein